MAQNEGRLVIGWSSTSITPEQPVQLHGQHYERISEYVRDPVTATVLALETVDDDGNSLEQAIMVSCDLVNLIREVTERVRGSVAGRLDDFDANKLFLNATHTHTGPTMMGGHYPEPPEGVMKPEEYAQFFVERISDAIVAAWEDRAPGGVSGALGHAAIGFNRRVVYDDGTAKMYGTSDTERFLGVEGTNDHGVEILFFWNEDALKGVLVNVGCPSQVVEGQPFVSADFWAAARRLLRERFSDDLHVFAMTGAAGDQSPRDLVRRGRGEPNFRDEDGLEEMGRRIARAVAYAYETAQSEIGYEVVFQHHTEELSLPMRKATAEDAESARAGLAKLREKGAIEPNSLDGMWVRRYQGAIDRLAEQGQDPRYQMALHVIRLGDVAFCTNPFELYLDFGLRIKARSRARQTFIAQLTDDRGKYLPTRKAVAHGHYGAMIYDNIVGPEGGDVLVERTLELINGMW